MSTRDAGESGVWKVRRPLNYVAELQMQGGLTAPLLAGFSLTAIVQLVNGAAHPWLSQWAIGVLAVSATCFVYALQLSGIAVGLSASPSQRIEMYPEAKRDPSLLKYVRDRQWQDMHRRGRVAMRAGVCYNLGMMAFLGGLALLVVPRQWNPVPLGRLVGLAVLGVAFVIELAWAASKARRPRWLLALPASGEPADAMPDDTSSLIFGERD